METEATPPSGSSSSSAAYSRWVLLARNDQFEDEDARLSGDDKSAAACFTSAGRPIRLSLRVAAPPALSRMRVHAPEGGVRWNHPHVIAAHGDSLLIQILIRFRCRDSDYSMDHFLYSAGDGNGRSRPPSARLLPHCYFTVHNVRRSFCDQGASPRGSFIEDRSAPRMLDQNVTGLLGRRSGNDGFVVAELQMAPSEPRKPVAELLLLRSSGKWTVKRAPIAHASDKCRELALWKTNTVVPVGDRLLCWVDLSRGVIFSDVFEDKPGLRYVSLPSETPYNRYFNSRNVCATAGGVVKFVNIFHTHRCGCGGVEGNRCPDSCYACIVQTWTMRMDDTVWVMDATVDATEFWALDAWKGVPRVQLDCPVVSIEDPMVICFVVCHARQQWMIMVDTRSKTVQAVSRGPELGDMQYCPETAIPNVVQGILYYRHNR
ncbi:hypothetical protein EJB05_29175, partial [Eragrostis curvula]